MSLIAVAIVFTACAQIVNEAPINLSRSQTGKDRPKQCHVIVKAHYEEVIKRALLRIFQDVNNILHNSRVPKDMLLYKYSLAFCCIINAANIGASTIALCLPINKHHEPRSWRTNTLLFCTTAQQNKGVCTVYSTQYVLLVSCEYFTSR